MSHKKRRKTKRPHHTPLASHVRKGSKLLGPLAALNVQPVDWLRDLLPEHLWLAALADQLGFERFSNAYNEFMDALDSHWPHKFVALGLVSDFGLIPESERQKFLASNHELVRNLFHRPLGRIMSLYSDGPANWLVQRELLDEGGAVDPFVELGSLRRLVLRLVHGKDRFAGRLRAVPLNRLFKHNMLYLQKSLPVVDLLSRYPAGLSEEEQSQVEAFARSTLNMSIQQREVADVFAWSKYFWRHNFELLPCRPEEKPVVGAIAFNPLDRERIAEALQHNAHSAREHLDLLRNRLRSDLYDPGRDEILFGLFARVTRLYVLLAEDPNLWARDVSGIMLRSLTESAISFCYLAKMGLSEDFQRFKEYGEGQQKLLMLQLQDNYPGRSSLEGLSSKELAEELEVWPELINIELGHWAKKDARRLAQEAGMEQYYRLVFSPASGDLHGSWMSLKSSNLVHCVEPLHKWHRLPTYAEPPFFIYTAIAAQQLYQQCQEDGARALGYPTPTSTLEDLHCFQQKPNETESNQNSHDS